jgi:uncharacterized repeat protein (TIGR01451 family)
MKLIHRLLGGSAFFAGAALLPVLAYASTAANTTITNTVTVNYTDAANNAQTPIESSVAITVNLVASAPLLSSPADIDPSTENTLNQLTYVITGTANGPDTYDFSSVDTPTNMDANAVFSTPSVTLGGTTAAAAIGIGATSITVPFDGADDSNVNGIVAGDFIVIDPTGAAEVVEVDSVDETNGPAGNTVTINLVVATTAAHAYGAIIGERQEVIVDVTTDTVTTGTSGTHSVVTTATSQTAPNPATSQATATVITVRRPALTVTKYVRNDSNAAFNPGVADITVDTVDYYASGVSGNPGDTMQYLIVIDNTAAGAGTANNIVVSDPVPQFTTFVGGSVELDATGTGAFVAQDETADNGDAAELDAVGNGTLYVYAGAGGDDTTAGAGNGDGGTLLASEISYVIFQVTID